MDKICICCGKLKPLSDYYRHGRMKDGHLNKCKECQKINSKVNYRRNIKDKIVYERKRSQCPDRKAKAVEYQRKRRLANPEKYKATCAVANAVRDGRLVKLGCEECGDKKSQAHHEDYSKPLDVIWLCRRCHLVRHNKIAY